MNRAKFLLTAVTATAVCIFSSAVAQASDVLDGATVIASSSFTGENGHVVSGEIDVVQKGDIYYVVLRENFLFNGA